jgi:negative regulator of sigma E activity
MNCQEFELIVHDMAREQPLDAAVRREGLAHVSACASCAGLLAASHSLSLGLRALAAESELKQAPAPVEAVLLEAFQQQRRRARAMRRPSWWELARWVMAKWVPAVAALAVLAVALAVRYWHAPRPVREAQGARVSTPSAGEVQPAGKSRATAPLTADSTRRQAPSVKLHSSRASAVTAESEFTDFVPLAGFADPLDVEQGEVVRISLPVSAVADLGLPVNEDAEQTTILAEVLIAEDGTARAVRFPR